MLKKYNNASALFPNVQLKPDSMHLWIKAISQSMLSYVTVFDMSIMMFEQYTELDKICPCFPRSSAGCKKKKNQWMIIPFS